MIFLVKSHQMSSLFSQQNKTKYFRMLSVAFVIHTLMLSMLGKNFSRQHTRAVQKVLSLIGFLSFIPGIFYNASLHLNGVLNS